MNVFQSAAGAFSLVLATVLLAGCGKWSVIREGDWNGQHYTIEERSSAGPFASTNSLDWRIKVGRLPAVPINASTHDWAPPYSTDLYGADAYSFIATRDTAYVDTPFTPGTIGVAHTMLYISPRTLDEEQYETFLHFMMEEFPRLSDSLTGEDLREFPHLIGLVYGDRGKYVQSFRGTLEGTKKIIRIEPDGRISLVDDNKWANESWSGLAPKVRMPGKVLRLCPPGSAGAALTPDAVRLFRDERGAPVDVIFKVVAEEHPGCR